MLPVEQREYLEDEVESLLNYLGEYLGPITPSFETLQSDSILRENYLAGQIKSIININIASVDELARLPGITQDIAQNIVEYRTANGMFKSTQHLGHVEAIDDEELDKLKPLVTVN